MTNDAKNLGYVPDLARIWLKACFLFQALLLTSLTKFGPQNWIYNVLGRWTISGLFGIV